MVKIQIPKEQNKIKKQIAVLENLIRKDTIDKDKRIHQQAIAALKEALKAE